MNMMTLPNLVKCVIVSPGSTFGSPYTHKINYLTRHGHSFGLFLNMLAPNYVRNKNVIDVSAQGAEIRLDT